MRAGVPGWQRAGRRSRSRSTLRRSHFDAAAGGRAAGREAEALKFPTCSAGERGGRGPRGLPAPMPDRALESHRATPHNLEGAGAATILIGKIAFDECCDPYVDLKARTLQIFDHEDR